MSQVYIDSFGIVLTPKEVRDAVLLPKDSNVVPPKADIQSLVAQEARYRETVDVGIDSRR